MSLITSKEVLDPLKNNKNNKKNFAACMVYLLILQNLRLAFEITFHLFKISGATFDKTISSAGKFKIFLISFFLHLYISMEIENI